MKQQELTFDEIKHEYKLNGLTIPNVTTILQRAGLVDLSHVPQETLDYKSDLGKKVHKTTELFDKRTLNKEKLHPTLQGYLNAWMKFCWEMKFIPGEDFIEWKHFHPLYKYAGTVDRIGTILDQYISQVDIKSGVPMPHYAYQSAAYSELWNYGKPKKDQVKKRYAVYLFPDGIYKLHEYKDKDDLRIFYAALTIANTKNKLKMR